MFLHLPNLPYYNRKIPILNSSFLPSPKDEPMCLIMKHSCTVLTVINSGWNKSLIPYIFPLCKNVAGLSMYERPGLLYCEEKIVEHHKFF